jgi:CDP-diacylglycerol--glycerol-3-phosphate 3-phosphatidyltransferase
MGHSHIGISSQHLPWILLCILLVVELSDAFDGYLARRLNQVTDVGKIIDPMADSITRISLFLAFTQPPINLSIIWGFILLYRDAWVSLLRTLSAFHGIALGARRSGKIKTILLSTASFLIIGALLLYQNQFIPLENLTTYANFLAGITALYALLTGFEYFYAHRHHLRKIISRPNSTENHYLPR